MATSNNIKSLISELTALAGTTCISEGTKRSISNQALNIVLSSGLDKILIKTVCSAIRLAANPSGYYYESHGIKAGLEVLERALEKAEETKVSPIQLNRANLKNLVSDGSIFNVKFVKRSSGDLRSMTCRTGVQKHKKGGTKPFSDSAKGLLTVFDMQSKGYRSIPLEGIQSLSINGQSFTFARA